MPRSQEKRKSLSTLISWIEPNLAGLQKKCRVHYWIALSVMIFCFFSFGMVQFFQIVLTLVDLSQYILWVSIAPAVGMLIGLFFAIRNKKKEKVLQNLFQVIETIQSKKKITVEELNLNAEDEEVKVLLQKLIDTENLKGYVLNGNTLMRSKQNEK